jgi:pantothenate synthetase
VWKALNIGLDLFNTGETNSHRLEAAMVRTIQLAPAARVDYVEIADADTLQPVNIA